jgi:hypothetical protein
LTTEIVARHVLGAGKLPQPDQARIVGMELAEVRLVGAQRIGQHECVAAVILGPGDGEPVAEAVQLLGVDREDRKAGFQQNINHGPPRRFDGGRHGASIRGGSVLNEPIEELSHSLAAMFEGQFPDAPALVIQ